MAMCSRLFAIVCAVTLPNVIEAMACGENAIVGVCMPGSDPSLGMTCGENSFCKDLSCVCNPDSCSYDFDSSDMGMQATCVVTTQPTRRTPAMLPTTTLANVHGGKPCVENARVGICVPGSDPSMGFSCGEHASCKDLYCVCNPGTCSYDTNSYGIGMQGKCVLAPATTHAANDATTVTTLPTTTLLNVDGVKACGEDAIVGLCAPGSDPKSGLTCGENSFCKGVYCVCNRGSCLSGAPMQGKCIPDPASTHTTSTTTTHTTTDTTTVTSTATTHTTTDTTTVTTLPTTRTTTSLPTTRASRSEIWKKEPKCGADVTVGFCMGIGCFLHHGNAECRGFECKCMPGSCSTDHWYCQSDPAANGAATMILPSSPEQHLRFSLWHKLEASILVGGMVSTAIIAVLACKTYRRPSQSLWREHGDYLLLS